MVGNREKVIWDLTNKLHKEVDDLYEALMDHENEDVKAIINTITSKLREITRISKSNA